DVDDLPESLRQLSTTGLLRDEQPRTVERWIDAASGAGLIQVSNDEYRTLSLTPFGRDVMAGRVDEVQMAVPTARQPRSSRRRSPRQRQKGGSTSVPRVVDDRAFEAVFAALRAWRLDQA